MIFKAGQEDTAVIDVKGHSYDPEYHEDLPNLGSTFPDFKCVRNRPTGTKFGRVIKKVCLRWKDIALGTPGLWTTISLTIPTNQSPKSVASLFQRSRSLPLDLRLKFCPSDGNTLTGEILQHLRSQLYRVRVLVLLLATDPQALSSLFPEKQHFEMCHLERFYCDFKVGFDLPWLMTSFATLRAPKIKTFFVHPHFAHLIRNIFPPSFEKLTRMDIGFKYLTTEQDLKPISQCRELRSLFWCRRPLPNSLPCDFNFHHLQWLSVLLNTEESCLAFSQHFYTPMLEHFYVDMCSGWHGHMPGYRGKIDWIVPFLQRNSQLKRFMIELAEIRDDMSHVFTHLTHLTTLIISGCKLSQPFIVTFLPDVNGQLILPNLRLLHFLHQLPPANLLEVARSRLTGDGATSANLNIIFSTYAGSEHQSDELNRLVEEYPQNCTFITLVAESEVDDDSGESEVDDDDSGESEDDNDDSGESEDDDEDNGELEDDDEENGESDLGHEEYEDGELEE